MRGTSCSARRATSWTAKKCLLRGAAKHDVQSLLQRHPVTGCRAPRRSARSARPRVCGRCWEACHPRAASQRAGNGQRAISANGLSGGVASIHSVGRDLGGSDREPGTGPRGDLGAGRSSGRWEAAELSGRFREVSGGLNLMANGEMLQPACCEAAAVCQSLCSLDGLDSETVALLSLSSRGGHRGIHPARFQTS